MTGNLIQYKFENTIYKDFISLVKDALVFFDVKGWQVRQLRQVLNVNVLVPTIFVSVILKHQAGSQYQSNAKVQDAVRQVNRTKQEVKIRFYAIRKRRITDKEDTLYPIDVLEVLSSWMQSEQGINALARLNYAQYRAGNITNQDFLDDSEEVEFMPFFECDYLYTDSWTTTIPYIDKYKYDIYKI